MITSAEKEQMIYEAMKRVTRVRPTCAWCPDFKPSARRESHGMCGTCEARLNAELAIREAGLNSNAK